MSLFVVFSAAGLRNVLLVTCVGGLLPGEEVVEEGVWRAILFRMVPYWFNNWDQQWGVEASSMLYALPHFSLEFLVLLPLVQVPRSPLTCLPNQFMVSRPSLTSPRNQCTLHQSKICSQMQPFTFTTNSVSPSTHQKLVSRSTYHRLLASMRHGPAPRPQSMGPGLPEHKDSNRCRWQQLEHKDSNEVATSGCAGGDAASLL